ncbi:MAG TPA: hypothetical protein VGJ26_19090, partial [Pirellulales bacterium]
MNDQSRRPGAAKSIKARTADGDILGGPFGRCYALEAGMRRSNSRRNKPTHALLGGKARRSNRRSVGRIFGLGISGLYSRSLRIEPLEDRNLLSAVSWDGGGDGKNWTDKLNWSGDVLPGANDDVTINAPGGVTVSATLSATTTIHSLTVGADDGLTLLSNSSLTVAAASTISGALNVSSSTLAINGATSVGNLNFTGGTISGAGDLTVTGNLYWQSGSMTGSGRTIVAPVASLSMAIGSPSLSRILENDGAAFWNASNLSLNNGTFQNNGTFYTASGTGFSFVSISGSGTSAFNNAGTFIQQGVQTQVVATSGGAMLFNNSGSVVVQTATLDLGGGGVNTGSISIANGAELRVVSGALYSFAAGASVTGSGAVEVAGGTLSVDASTSATNLVLSSGTLTGARDLTVTGGLTWVNGSMTGAGKTIVAPGASLILDLASSPANPLLARTLENDGSAVWVTGFLHMNNGVFQNNGSFTLTSTAQLLATPDGGVNAFYNTGTFTNANSGLLIIGGAATTTVAFNNTGTINGQLGTIKLEGGGNFGAGSTIAGTVQLARSPTATPTYTFGATTEVMGNLTVGVPVNFDSPVSFVGPGKIQMANVSGSADITFHTNLTWTTGVMSGTGKTVIASDGTMNFSGGAALGLNRVLE